MKKIAFILLLTCFAAACATAPGTSTPNPNSPVVQQLGTLNTIAVGVAVVGGLVGLGLALFRRNQPQDEPSEPEPIVKSAAQSSKKKKKRRK